MATPQGYTSFIMKFSDKVQATISVKLINGDGKDPANIYGTILIGQFPIVHQLPLFDARQQNNIPVRPGECIPLVAPEGLVPSRATNFDVIAYLADYDVVSPDHEIAKGAAKFLVKGFGESDKGVINGKYGSIEVVVVWG